MNPDDQLTVINLLIDHELKLAELYRHYAPNQSDYHDFWENIADEEVFHSEWIKALRLGLEQNKYSFDDKRFETFAIETSINKLNGLIVNADAIATSVKKSFETAYQYEHSLIETDFFRVFQGDSPEIASVLNKLREATIHHAELIREKLEFILENS